MAGPNINDTIMKMSQNVELMNYKLSMPDSTIQIGNALFYLPNFPVDMIQRMIVTRNNYFDPYALQVIDEYLPNQSTILDIGANIGNHSLYWAIERNAKKIYSFEPLDSIYKILAKNVEINKLEDIIIPHNFGLYKEDTNASVEHTNLVNLGNTSFKPGDKGRFKLKRLDSLGIEDKIDLIKIDVEGVEVEVLVGGTETIKKSQPTIVVESFHRKFEVDNFMDSIDYELVKTIREGEDYIYQPKGKSE